MAFFKVSILLAVTAFLSSISAADQIADYAGNFSPAEEEATAQPAPPNAEQLKIDFMKAVETAQATHIPPEGMGFLPPHTAGVPARVSFAENSVFKIVVPAGDLVDSSVLLKGLSLEQGIAYLKNLPPNESVRQIDKDIFIIQLQNCLRDHVQPCKIYDGNSSGTAFVTGDGKELRTALHEVKWTAKDVYAGRIKGNLPILLVNSRGQTFYPDQLGAHIAAVYAGALDKTDGQNPPNYGLDQIVIRLNKAVAAPLPVAKESAQAGQRIYMVGFPIATSDRYLFSALDANGKSVRVTRGTVLDQNGVEERGWKSGIEIDRNLTSKLLSQGLALTADGTPGMSGAPILNANGEVVGVYTAGLPQSGAAWPSRISYGANHLLSVH
jgi:hypothetical protein